MEKKRRKIVKGKEENLKLNGKENENEQDLSPFSFFFFFFFVCLSLFETTEIC